MNSNNFLPLLTKRIAYTLLFIKHLKINEENVVKKSLQNISNQTFLVYIFWNQTIIAASCITVLSCMVMGGGDAKGFFQTVTETFLS